MTPKIHEAFAALITLINTANGRDAGNRRTEDGLGWTKDTRVITFGYIGNAGSNFDARHWTVWFPEHRLPNGNATKASAGYLPTDASIEDWRDLYRAARTMAQEFGYLEELPVA